MSEIQKQFNAITKKVRLLTDRLRSRQVMDELAREAAILVRKRTRLGYGVNKEGGEKTKLEKLSPLYIKQRKRNAFVFTSKQGKIVVIDDPKKARKYNKIKLTSSTSPSKSNLTKTGEMLDSIVGKVVRAGRAELYLDGSRNKEVAGYVQNKRPFFHLSRLEQLQLERILRTKYRQLVTQLFDTD